MDNPIRFLNRQELEHYVVLMHEQGWSMRKLSKMLKMSRNTVKEILKKVNDDREKGHDILSQHKRISRTSKLDSFIPSIKELLNKHSNITGQRVFEELVFQGFDGGITIVRDKLKLLRPTPKKKPHVRFETEPCKQGQMDWSPYTIKFTRTGKAKVNCFSYILAFSRRHFIDFTERRNFHTLIRRHHDAFTYFGGVVETCLYDNEKTVVLRWEAGQPIFNPSFLCFITHYHCRPIACKPRTPWHKGKVEAPFQYVEKNLLNARDFEDLDDLKAWARWWLKNRSDTHIHDTTNRAPLELFMESEAHRLLPLPMHSYDTSEVGYRICRLDGFVEWDTSTYSVPYEYVAELLVVKASEEEIVIFGPDLRKIATHERLSLGANGKIELTEHRNSKKIRYGLEPVRELFLALGTHSEEFLRGLQSKYPRNCGFHARRILILKQRYHCDDIHKALRHAIRYHAYDTSAVERILKARFKERTLEEVKSKEAVQRLRSALPKIEQRSLGEYQALFKGSNNKKGADNE